MWGRGNRDASPAPSHNSYARIPDGHGSHTPPRSAARAFPAPQSAQFRAPPTPYEASSALLGDRRQNDRRHPQPRSLSFEVVNCPSDELVFSNCLIVHHSDFQSGQHVLVNHTFLVTVRADNTGTLRPGTVGPSQALRQWMELSMSDPVQVDALPLPPDPAAPSYLQSVDLEIGFYRRNAAVDTPFPADKMMETFVNAFNTIVMSVGQIVMFEFHGHKLKATVKSISVVELADEQRRGSQRTGGTLKNQFSGIVMEMTDVNFLQAPDGNIRIKASGKKAPANAILAPNFKFEDMGIGGLDSEFNDIFRRAFASRVFPPALVEKLGIEHVKGILLYGPPGTGKTLIARQIGKMLNAREPKIVNGPEVLSKFVGQSEENVRKLFADAEKEFKEKGDESGLHIIIFDELDAIFKQRGSTNNGTGVGDTVVNQLLSKMDGVDQLNNILIIGMTNRKDMIDEALLRPGRLEVHMEISLPDERGRFQILSIHTSKMRTNGVMDDDVDLEELATVTKNFSGAEITGLVKSATSFAFNRHVKVGTMAGIADDVENLRVNRADFMHALEEVRPAFGVSEEELEQVIQNGIIHFHPIVDETLRNGRLYVEQVRTSARTPLVSVLLYGPPGTGKTALSASVAKASEFPFIKLISPDNMVGYSEAQKVQNITKIFMDSYKSPLSVVVVDNVERLIDWTPMGARFSNAVLQTLLVLLARRPPKGRRLLILATSSMDRELLNNIGLRDTFDYNVYVSPITTLSPLKHVIREARLFESDEALRKALKLLREAGIEGEDDLSPAFQFGIKKLLSVIEMARQEPENAADRLRDGLIALRMP